MPVANVQLNEKPALYLLDGIALHGVSPEVGTEVLKQSKSVALLAYLYLSTPGVFQRRDRIVGLLWPEQDQQHARAALRKTIHNIKKLLGDGVLATSGDDDVAANHDALWCDATQVRMEVDRGRLARAIELYKGDLMPGFFLPECNDFESWLDARRTELHELAVNTCMNLARLLESESDSTQAGMFAKRAARLAGTNERVLRRCLIMLDRLGDRAGAIMLYTEFATRLRRELDVTPSRETETLVEALRAGRTLPST